LCVVIGGGSVALRKVKSLLEAEALVKLISVDIASEIREFKNVELVNRAYKEGDLKGSFVVIAATDDEAVNKQIAKEAREVGALLNIADKPSLGDFYVPSVVKRGDLVINISTGGNFPALSKKIRKKLELEFGPEYGQYLNILGEARNKVIAEYSDVNKRKAKLEEIANFPVIELIRKGEIEKAKEQIESCI
jgi:precorrin-2 dehydrogenase/sirohydrochlorin ferrochelatase